MDWSECQSPSRPNLSPDAASMASAAYCGAARQLLVPAQQRLSVQHVPPLPSGSPRRCNLQYILAEIGSAPHLTFLEPLKPVQPVRDPVCRYPDHRISLILFDSGVVSPSSATSVFPVRWRTVRLALPRCMCFDISHLYVWQRSCALFRKLDLATSTRSMLELRQKCPV